MNLENAFDNMNEKSMSQALHMHAGAGGLGRSVKSLYKQIKARVSVCADRRERVFMWKWD